MLRLRYAFLAAAIVVSGCGGGSGGSGGGGGNPLPATTPTPTPPPPPTSSTTTQSVSAGAGGTVSATFNGQTTTVTIGAGALSATTMVSVTMYTASSLPRAFQTRGRQPQAVPVGSALLGGFSIDLGGATLLKPLKVALTASAPAAGQIVRLAVVNATAGGYVDIDTATFAGTTVTNDINPAYPSVSHPGGSAAPYAFYAVAPANAPAAPVPQFAITPSATPIFVGSSTIITASESDAFGDPYLNALTITADPVLGTTSAAGTPNAITLTANTTNSSGKITLSDPVSKANGSVVVDVVSTRPDAATDTFAYTGSMTETINRPLPAPAAIIPPLTTTTAIAQTVTVAPNSTYTSQSNATTPGLVRYTVVETDTAPLQTSVTTTQSFYSYAIAGATQTVSLVGTIATDSFGVKTQNTYPGTYLVDTIPEIAQSFSNNGAVAFLETDPDTTTIARTVATDGSYSNTMTFPDKSTAHIIVTGNAAGSYQATTIGSTPVTITVSAPRALATAPPPPPPAPTPAPTFVIPISTNVAGTPSSGTISDWYPGAGSAPVLYAEIDTITLQSSVSGVCAPVPAPKGQIAQLQQTITRLDPVLGTTETETVTQYVNPGLGVVCVTLNDAVQAYYDYSLLSDAFFSTTPQQITTISETLALNNASVAGTQSTQRSVSSVSPLALARTSFDRMLERRRMQRYRAFQSAIAQGGFKILGQHLRKGGR